MNSKQTHQSATNYEPHIDGLRGVAVLAVVIFHAFPSLLEGGFTGVDIFFVISGYLISKIIFESINKGNFSFTYFYTRRILRIFPALTLVLVSCLILGWFFLLGDEYKQLGKHVAAGASFIANFIFWNESGYFDNASDTKPLLHLWSLGIEEQFYIFWPILVWLTWKRHFNFITVIIFFGFLSFFLNIKEIQHDEVATFFSPITRFWEILSGSLLAWISVYSRSCNITFISQTGNDRADKIRVRHLASFLGLTLIALGFWQINEESSFPGLWALLPTAGTFCLLAAGPHAFINKKILAIKIAIWFGLISYPLYLWHWPILTFTRIISGETSSPAMRVSAILISVLLAWLTYRFFEHPIRSSNNAKKNTSVLILALAITGYFGYQTYKQNGLPYRAIAKQAADFEFSPDMDKFITCNIEELKTRDTQLTFCLLPKYQKPNSVIIGDSHAEDKFFSLASHDKENSWMLIGNSSCPPLLNVTVEANIKGCEEKFNTIFKYILRSDDIKNVALSFYANLYLKSDGHPDSVQNVLPPQGTKISSSLFRGTREDIFFAGLNSSIQKLISNGKTVTLFIDVPELPFTPKDCFRNPLKNCELLEVDVIERQKDFKKIVYKLKHQNPELRIYEPIDFACAGNKCSYKNNNVVLYRDSHHLSLRGSDFYISSFLKR
jgi:peptidoglycan/LPS O-acetylase OafA/YrhL